MLYSTGGAHREALALTLADVGLGDSLLMVRDSKFFKTRVVPTGPKLTAQLERMRNSVGASLVPTATAQRSLHSDRPPFVIYPRQPRLSAGAHVGRYPAAGRARYHPAS